MKLNRLKHFLIPALVFINGLCSAAVISTDLRCEYLTDPLGIDASSPRLSWVLSSTRRGEMQKAYQILVASSPKLLGFDKGDLWDSGKVASDESSQIIYAGDPLFSRENCYWKVRAWDRDGKPGEWSSVAHWSMGLLQPSDWNAKWIAPILSSEGTNATLIIRHATYETVAEGQSVDVTATLNSLIKDGRLKLVANNHTLRVDPANHSIKHLRVEYDYAGQTFKKEVGENQTLMLPKQTPVPYLRKEFELKSKVQQAVLYVTALGLYEVRVNGQRVGDHVLAPDWTDYRKRVRYHTFDVTSLLKTGGNALGALLADGWFSGHIGNGGFEYYGKEPSFFAQLEVTSYADGHTERIVTDETWKSHDSPILASDFMLGEDYNSQLEIKGWDKPGLNVEKWSSVTARDGSSRHLESQVMPPVREVLELKPKTVTASKSGGWIYDLGQNMVGIVRLKVSEAAGTVITLRHAEMLNPDGTLYTTNLRGAPSVDHYICKGDGVETWQPRFTFHGFRYVEISGLNGQPKKDAVTGIVIGTDTAWHR